MRLSEIKAEGYDGLHVQCDHCLRFVELSFDRLPDGEYADIASKLKCSKCGRRADKVTTFRDQIKSRIATGIANGSDK